MQSNLLKTSQSFRLLTNCLTLLPYALTADQGISVTQPSWYKNQIHNEEAPRYQIGFRGLSAYGNITDAVRMKILAMINHRRNAVFNNHSRDVDSLRRSQMTELL